MTVVDYNNSTHRHAFFYKIIQYTGHKSLLHTIELMIFTQDQQYLVYTKLYIQSLNRVVSIIKCLTSWLYTTRAYLLFFFCFVYFVIIQRNQTYIKPIFRVYTTVYNIIIIINSRDFYLYEGKSKNKASKR